MFPSPSFPTIPTTQEWIQYSPRVSLKLNNRLYIFDDSANEAARVNLFDPEDVFYATAIRLYDVCAGPDGYLYGISLNAGVGKLYRINADTLAATLIASPAITPLIGQVGVTADETSIYVFGPKTGSTATTSRIEKYNLDGTADAITPSLDIAVRGGARIRYIDGRLWTTFTGATTGGSQGGFAVYSKQLAALKTFTAVTVSDETSYGRFTPGTIPVSDGSSVVVASSTVGSVAGSFVRINLASYAITYFPLGGLVNSVATGGVSAVDFDSYRGVFVFSQRTNVSTTGGRFASYSPRTGSIKYWNTPIIGTVGSLVAVPELGRILGLVTGTSSTPGAGLLVDIPTVNSVRYNFELYNRGSKQLGDSSVSLSASAVYASGDSQILGSLQTGLLEPRAITSAVNEDTAGASTVGPGAGTSPTFFQITGGPICGDIEITTGTSPAANATLATVAWDSYSHSRAPRVFVEPANAAAAALAVGARPYVDIAGTSTTGFVLKSGSSALAAGTAYKWRYFIIE